MSVVVQNLTKIYGEQKAVNNISFEAKPGQVLGFLGPNGAGKTTTMKVLTCYIPQSSGQATVCGYDVQEAPMEVRQNIGYLPEHNPLYLDMYVREYLRFIAGLHKISKPNQRISEMIEMTGLEREQRKPIGALSKGYRQRVGLAQALLHDPQVLILDEPTAGLDPNQLADIRALIKQLGEEKTVIFSTHIMQEVKAICDRVVIINRGNLVADDTIGHLQSVTTGESVITVEFQSKIPQQQLKKINGVKEVRQLNGYRYQILADAEEDLRASVFDFAVDQKVKLLEMRKEVFEMDEVFQRLTK
ncbi:MAG: gliding motility-associated ABC transporter ATP-binding subunit GldA [Phaeodactylibacter xiamenensis]|uniref:Gliding motility protein GldA n=1 Tax=Phaeodactylibacter xiamenensis TaxID=1524460 RepID=A0A098S3B9_9BACT|nr:gliding motility-associated ABC transporter ATP-binding subunit GldA [Phaeodactylibacter xiamenensis]KGE86799.1 gliding motility protein GldA [Phaeodactylibacter xiamenensis]MCR9053675.1 gliding motility-associated ABC transporter ATP-binding subunit GldA [bacterium]